MIYKLPSKQNLPSKTCKKNTLSTTRTIIALGKFVFHPNNWLVPLWI